MTQRRLRPKFQNQGSLRKAWRPLACGALRDLPLGPPPPLVPMLDLQNLLDVEFVFARMVVLRDPVDSTVTSGTGGFIPFSRRSSKGIETFAKRFVQ